MRQSDYVKQEIINQPLDKHEFSQLLAGYLHNHCSITYEKQTERYCLVISDFNAQVLQYLAEKIFEHFGYQPQLKINPNKKSYLKYYQVQAHDHLNQLANELVLPQKLTTAYQPLLMGSFLADGHICDFQKRVFGVELSTKSQQHQLIISKILKKAKIAHKLMQTTTRWVVSIRQINAISDFLKIINAINSMLALEDVVISNDFINQYQRLNNLDVANISKSTKSALAQVAIIKTIQRDKLITDPSQKETCYMNLRLTYQEASLNELVNLFWQKYQMKITKSNLNHIIRKFKQLVQK